MTMIKKIVTGAVIATSTLASLATVVQAGDWGHRGPDYGHGYHHAPAYAYQRRAYAAPHYGYGQTHRDHRGDRIAAGVAIGVGALILGSVLANQNRRHYNGY